MLAHPDERPFIVAKDALGRYVAIKVCAFGLASTPLLWCRLSSMAMRLAQACSEDHEARSHCFIDDPLVAVSAPTVRRRTKIMARFLLLWCVLGFKISWHKVCRGTTRDWIGVQLCVLGQVPTHLEVTLSEDKTAKLVEALYSLLTGPVIPIATLRNAVGVLGWLSGIIPEARPWLSMLWAALTEGSQRSSVGPKRNTTRLRKGLLFRKQVEHGF